MERLMDTDPYDRAMPRKMIGHDMFGDTYPTCSTTCQKQTDCDDCPIQEAFARLRQYEQTSLTPEQVQELKERDAAKAPTVFESGKGIIVMDIPKNCGECRFYRQFVGFAQSCVISGRDVDSRCKPSWCPIKQASNRERGMGL